MPLPQRTRHKRIETFIEKCYSVCGFYTVIASLVIGSQRYFNLKRGKIMIKILFVCHGNICRSPMAEFLMKELVRENGLENDFYIESAATSTEEIGNGVYPPVKRILKARGIDCSAKHARQMTRADYDKFDYIVCMDQKNLRNMGYIAIDTQNKYSRLLDFTENPHDVADPWYSGDFETTEREVESGCEALLQYILNK